MYKCRYFLIIFLTILTSGCLSKPDLPGQHSGSLTIQLQFQANTENKDIQLIKGVLSMNDGELEQERTIVFNGDSTRLFFEKVYPGNWGVSISAVDSVNDTIFQGAADIVVASEKSNEATVSLSPASASLDINFDASPVPGIGSTYSSGRFGVYLNPLSNRGTYYDLTLKNKQLCGNIKNIPEGSYQARICIPKATSPIYATPRFQIQLSAGKKSIIHVKADGTVIANPKNDQWPPTPSRVNLTRQGSIVTLSWTPVTTANVTAYRVYRTNSSGFYTLITTLNDPNTQFSETVSSKMAHGKRIWYAISCIDSSGVESLWSNNCEVTF